VVDKNIQDVRIVVSGVGAAGNAIIRLLLAQGATDIIGCGRNGAVHSGQKDMDQFRTWIAENTNTTNNTGTLKEVLTGADVFIGVSGANLLTGDDIATMAKDSIVFALANPTPEVDAVEASTYAAVVATGRSDYPNQINDVLVFPGFFRGLLDAVTSEITDEMLIAAATAIASTVRPDLLNASYIVPSVFDTTVAPAVAAAVLAVATTQDQVSSATHDLSHSGEHQIGMPVPSVS
jgi:malate dehydrogenase (oxaloacetate-decarboxylating)